ncbi:antibiotic biosynthesis monooxygenase [Geodermatophilus sp. SYSU D00742]
MIIVAGHLTVRPEDRAAHLAGCRAVVQQARAAPGCLDFAVTADLLDDGRIDVFERWRTRAELEAFRGTGPSDAQTAVLLGAAVAEYDVVPAHGGTPLPVPDSIGSPAASALLHRGVRDLRDLTALTERELLSWHGIGPKAVSRLREAMAAQGLAFRS